MSFDPSDTFLFVYIECISKIKDTFCWERTCLLDMDATTELSPSDGCVFDFIIVGGILGNVPSDDRTSVLRDLKFIHTRHMGPIQMTTNTAVLVAKFVLEDGIPLNKISYVDSPEIKPNECETIVLPFRFVARNMITHTHTHTQETDTHTQEDFSDKAPVLPDGFVEFLQEDDL
eukprot:GHVR01014418.1.p1 GENE.GHVR01014418.1~~GHVR01014418.1.p1  ORF type:complete len:174 (+),score=52.79 GHVR01014418.1:357-878(+)